MAKNEDIKINSTTFSAFEIELKRRASKNSISLFVEDVVDYFDFSILLDAMPQIKTLSIISAPNLKSVESLKLLKSLMHLTLYDCNLDGSTHISNLTLLESLDLSCNPFESISFIHDLDQLKKLTLNECYNLYDCKQIVALPSLEELYLEDIHGLDMTDLSNSSSIQYVYGYSSESWGEETSHNVFNCRSLADPHWSLRSGDSLFFSQCPSLETFEFNEQDPPDMGTLEFDRCNSLRSIGFQGDQHIEDLRIKSCTELKELNLGYAQLDSLSIADCPKIEVLDLDCSTDLARLAIARCPSLATLTFPETDRLSSLTLSGETGVDVLSLSNITSLRKLKLVGISKLKSIELIDLTLEKVNIDGCDNLRAIEGYKLNRIKEVVVKNCPSITSISFSGCSLRKITIEGCSALKSVDLSFCDSLSLIQCSTIGINWNLKESPENARKELLKSGHKKVIY